MKRALYFITLCWILPYAAMYGQDFQPLTLTAIDGKRVSLQEMVSNGPTLVTFWALWCEPCKLELRHLQSLYEKYKDEQFSILAVNQDNQKSIAKVSSFISSHEYTFTVVTDPNGEVAQTYNVRNIPFGILYDRNGIAVYTSIGYKPGDERELEAQVQKLIRRNDAD